MLIKVKVSDVAKDFGKQSKEIVQILSEYCEGAAKKPSSVLEEDELNVLFDKITQDNSVESFDAYFATRKPQEKTAEKTSEALQAEPKTVQIPEAHRNGAVENGDADNYGSLEKYTEQAKREIRCYMNPQVRREHMQLLNPQRPSLGPTKPN